MKQIKTYILILFLVNMHFNSFSQNENYWLRKCDTNGCGYIDKTGRIRIDIGKYYPCFTDTLYSYAIVHKTGHGFVAIDREEKELFQVYSVDNGPDYISEGLFRIVENGKIGFANINGEIVIYPRFDIIFPFSHGLASFCEECISVPDEQIPEYTKPEGGLWGFINKNGEVVIKPDYNRQWNQELRKFQYIKNDTVFIINNGILEELK